MGPGLIDLCAVEDFCPTVPIRWRANERRSGGAGGSATSGGGVARPGQGHERGGVAGGRHVVVRQQVEKGPAKAVVGGAQGQTPPWTQAAAQRSAEAATGGAVQEGRRGRGVDRSHADSKAAVHRRHDELGRPALSADRGATSLRCEAKRLHHESGRIGDEKVNRLVAGTLGTRCVESSDTGATFLGALGATALRRALFPVSETLGAILPAWAAWRSRALWEVLTFMHMLMLGVSRHRRARRSMASWRGLQVAVRAVPGWAVKHPRGRIGGVHELPG